MLNPSMLGFNPQNNNMMGQHHGMNAPDIPYYGAGGQGGNFHPYHQQQHNNNSSNIIDYTPMN